MNKLSVAQRAYIAGFLDGDGSVYVRLKPNSTYRFHYQVAPYVVFFQAMKERHGLAKIQQMAGVGYLRERNDGIVEYTIGDMPSITALLTTIKPYLLLKRRQAELMIDILRMKKLVRNATDFIKLCALIDQFKELNYSKRRTQTKTEVQKVLEKEGILTP